jgi:hypothetical protein
VIFTDWNCMTYCSTCLELRRGWNSSLNRLVFDAFQAISGNQSFLQSLAGRSKAIAGQTPHRLADRHASHRRPCVIEFPTPRDVRLPLSP